MTVPKRRRNPTTDPTSAVAHLTERPPPLDSWLADLGVDVVDRRDHPGGLSIARDVLLDGSRRFDLRVTVAWVDGVGLSLWAYYGQEGMEIPKRVFHRMLRAGFDYPLVKFALTDDDRPMLVTELPPAAVSRDELGRGLARLVIVSDRLLDETRTAIRDRGELPDWSGRESRNPTLLVRYRAEVESAMPAWDEPLPLPASRRRRGLGALLGRRRGG